MGKGYGTEATTYGAFKRIEVENSPVLTCSQQNDRFTVNDTTKGNGALAYPVGLITVDELEMAGTHIYGNDITNKNIYLYTGTYYWTMSPYSYDSYLNAIGFNMYEYGMLGANNLYNSAGVRPVISLKSSVILTGTGTMDDPYVVQ